MTRIGMGLVGPGFVGAHHIDAVRRLGFVDVVAVAGSSRASAQKKADALGVPKAYGSYGEVADDPAVHVVHNTTQNHASRPPRRATAALTRASSFSTSRDSASSAFSRSFQPWCLRAGNRQPRRRRSRRAPPALVKP